jgi:hypothetical protein
MHPSPEWNSGSPSGIARNGEFVEPDQADLGRPDLFAKIFQFRPTQITSISAAIPGPHRGAFRDRHGRRARDAMDAKMLLTNSVCADGEVVWS